MIKTNPIATGNLSRIGIILALWLAVAGCANKNNKLTQKMIGDIELKRGPIIWCSGEEKQFGQTSFDIAGNEKLKADFNLAVSLLHSFEYDEAEKAFANILTQDPECSMAYWGVAMANFHPLWTPPTEPELIKGTKAIRIALSLKSTPKEKSFINAISVFYQDWETVGHRTRCLHFEKGMERVFTRYPEDPEAAIFYALALVAAAEPSDKSFEKQIKASEILQSVYPDQPNHPGIVHYLIHTFDYPLLAQQGLDAARQYAAIAPSSAHALHMPSHIFTRLGLWDESIQSNQASVTAAQCYAELAGISGHWDEELHGLDYLTYAQLQKGNNKEAMKLWNYVNGIQEVYPVNFKVAYAFAAIPSRYLLENKQWSDAAQLVLTQNSFPWEKFPWQKAILHFTRTMGALHIGELMAAQAELDTLQQLKQRLLDNQKTYEANQVAIQIKSGEAWLFLMQGKSTEALASMHQAVDMEEQTEKHPVTPGEVIPARELLGDMLMAMQKPAQALQAYEQCLQKAPNRFNSVYGAGSAAEKINDLQKAKYYYGQLFRIADHAMTDRLEFKTAKQFLDNVSG